MRYLNQQEQLFGFGYLVFTEGFRILVLLSFLFIPPFFPLRSP